MFVKWTRSTQRSAVQYLEHCEQALPKAVKIGSGLDDSRVKVELSSKHLHSQQRKDHNEEKEQ